MKNKNKKNNIQKLKIAIARQKLQNYIHTPKKIIAKKFKQNFWRVSLITHHFFKNLKVIKIFLPKKLKLTS